MTSCYSYSHLGFGTDTDTGVQQKTPVDSSSIIQDLRCSHRGHSGS